MSATAHTVRRTCGLHRSQGGPAFAELRQGERVFVEHVVPAGWALVHRRPPLLGGARTGWVRADCLGVTTIRDPLAIATIGQAPPGEMTPAEEQRFVDRLNAGLREITPALLLVGIATGFAYAVGSGLGSAFVERYIFSRGREGG